MTTLHGVLAALALLAVTQPGLSAPITAPQLVSGMSWNYRIEVENQPNATFRVRVQAGFPNVKHEWVLDAIASPAAGPENQNPPQILGALPAGGCLTDVRFAFSLAFGDRCLSDPAGTSWVTEAAVHGSKLTTGSNVTDIKVNALGRESVAVPAGTFDALHLHANFQATLVEGKTGEISDVDADYWFATNEVAPVKIIRRFSSAQKETSVLTEELIDSGVRPIIGMTVPNKPTPPGYFLEFGRAYASTLRPKWTKELCDEMHPDTSAANQVAYDAWHQRNQNVIEELNAQFGIMQRYWDTQPNPTGKPPPDSMKIRDSLELQREPLRKHMLESQKSRPCTRLQCPAEDPSERGFRYRGCT